MKVLYLAGIEDNTGPGNANRAFYEYWPAEDDVRALVGKGLTKLIPLIKGLMWCDVVVTPGPGRIWDIVRPFARVRRLPTAGYCHGYLPYENDINGLGLSMEETDAYAKWLDSVDVVVTNSEYQKKFLLEAQPSLKDKVSVVRLGVNPFFQAAKVLSSRPKKVVAVSGGTRPIKGNDVVARAVRQLRKNGIDVELRVYGDRNSVNPELDELVQSCGMYMGQIPRDQFIRQLEDVDVFVMDSRHEPFGLSVLDALEAGCSVLASRNCGVRELIQFEEVDSIINNEDALEVADKILRLLERPNGSRLYESIDFEKCSWANSANEYRVICAASVDEKARLSK